MDGVGFEAAIEWIVSCVYDRVEDRFGRLAALFVGFSLALGLLGLFVAGAWYFLIS
jgi:hypothetical protein